MMNLDEYLYSLFPEDTVLQNIHSAIDKNQMPQISVQPMLGRLLTWFVQTTSSTRVLEIGALAGYSAICLARGLPENGHVWSIENNPTFAKVAKSHLDSAGLGHRVTLIEKDALVALAGFQLEKAIFDFIFIDADKMNYPAYLDYAIELSRPGTLIIGDNVLLRNRVTDPETTSPSPIAMRAFNAQFASHPKLESLILPLYDGLALARVKA
jgi:caffeoyl-CoA O-methyltransferase